MSTKPYILYVEDDEIEIMKFMNAMKDLLDTNEVKIAYNGQEGYNLLNENKHHLPKIIILDINMPVMDGLKMLELVKSDNNLKQIPVLMLTTSNNKTDIQKSFKNQVAGYFVKPFSPLEYMNIISIIKKYWNTSYLAS